MAPAIWHVSVLKVDSQAPYREDGAVGYRQRARWCAGRTVSTVEYWENERSD